MHEMAVYDFNTSVHVAKREGREEGIEIGDKRGRQAIHLGILYRYGN
jgi:hypothetical protein